MGVELIGLEHALNRFKEAREQADNPADFQEEAAFVMLNDANNAFASGGPGWAPLDPKTVRRKGGNSQPLIRSRKYSRSFKPKFGAGIIDMVSSVYYSRFHQKGEGGLVKRAVMLSEQAQKLIVEAGRKAFGWK